MRIGLVGGIGQWRNGPVAKPHHDHPADQLPADDYAAVAAMLLADQDVLVVVEGVERHVGVTQVVDVALRRSPGAARG